MRQFTTLNFPTSLETKNAWNYVTIHQPEQVDSILSPSIRFCFGL